MIGSPLRSALGMRAPGAWTRPCSASGSVTKEMPRDRARPSLETHRPQYSVLKLAHMLMGEATPARKRVAEAQPLLHARPATLHLQMAPFASMARRWPPPDLAHMLVCEAVPARGGNRIQDYSTAEAQPLLHARPTTLHLQVAPFAGMARQWPPLELARMLVGEPTPAGKSVAEAQPALLGCLAAPLAQHAFTRATLDEVRRPWTDGNLCLCSLPHNMRCFSLPLCVFRPRLPVSHADNRVPLPDRVLVRRKRKPCHRTRCSKAIIKQQAL